MRSLVALLFASLAMSAAAATSEAYAVLDHASAAACRNASGLREAAVGAPTRFSDALLIDTRVVRGIWRQKHLKGASVTMLCAYNRRTKRVEVQEVPSGFVRAVGSVALRDIHLELLAKAVRAERGPKGSLVVTTRDGRLLRYTPSPKG
jgi:hypothetical protein